MTYNKPKPIHSDIIDVCRENALRNLALGDKGLTAHRAY